MATIYKNLLAKGYFPKELPPHFFTELFAEFATTKRGRNVLQGYSPTDKFTRCADYSLALPGQNTRQLSIPHPSGFSMLVSLTAEHFGRLLKRSARSPIARSRPIYSDQHSRAVRPSLKPSNLSIEQAAIRAGASYLLRVDVSQFYPSLYTHAVGWAIDPQLREKRNWQNSRLLGKKVDQRLMDISGKESQGIPIGNDVSFLLAELVLSEVDRKAKLRPARACRWFDDYQVACSSVEEAEKFLAQLTGALEEFRLRINPRKTSIERLPLPAMKPWQTELNRFGKGGFPRAKKMVEFFDTAFALRKERQDEPVLLYALGMLYGIECPNDAVTRIALSGITQSLLAEPGCAQKAFSLLIYWKLNGRSLDENLLSRTIEQVVRNHRALGVSSDVAWALAFCIETKLPLGRDAGKILSATDNNCVAIQALHMHSLGLLPKGFSTRKMSRLLGSVDLDDRHWLLGYEAYRQGFLNDSQTQVNGNSLFADLYQKRVTFYRTKLPSYAMVVHPGGAPEWIVRRWIQSALGREETRHQKSVVSEKIESDLLSLERKGVVMTADDAILHLLDIGQSEDFKAVVSGEDTYAV